MRPSRAAAGLAALLVLSAGACSDDGGGVDEDVSASPSGSEVEADDGGDELDAAAEEELIEAALLTVDDVPEGFEEGDPSDADDDTLEDCLAAIGLDGDDLDDSTVAEVDPVAFELAGDTGFASIEAEIRTVDPTDAAEAVLDAMGDGDFRECVLAGFLAAAEEDGQVIEDAALDEVDVPADGDESGGLAFTGGFSGFTFEGQILVVLAGNHLVSLELTTVDEAIAEDDVATMFETMLERLEG